MLCKAVFPRASRLLTTGPAKPPSSWSPYRMQSPFDGMATTALLRSLIVYRVCSFQWLARVTPRLVSFFKQVHMERLFYWMVKNTIYAQFCGGETIHDVQKIVERLDNNKIGTILDYAAEPDLSPSSSNFSTSEDALRDQVKLNVLEAIEATHRVPNSMVAVKLSGLFESSFLRLLNQSHRPAQGTDILCIEESPGWKHLNQICSVAKSRNVRIAIDAEQSFIQSAIDIIAWRLAEKYNRTDCSSRPFIVNTYQMYRKDALERLQHDISRAERTNCHFGAKIVRGAYIVGEQKWALEGQYECPVFSSIEETHASYNDAIRLIFRLAGSMKSTPGDARKLAFLFATHNLESLELAAECCSKGDFPAGRVEVIFAQLFGMSDTASLSMAGAGYTVYKYLPFGPVHAVIPYLIRRSEENSSIFKMAGSDAQIIWKELKSRIRPRRSSEQA